MKPLPVEHFGQSSIYLVIVSLLCCFFVLLCNTVHSNDIVMRVNLKITNNSLCIKIFFGTIRFFRRSIMKSHGGYKLKTKNKNSQNRNAAMVGGIRVGRAKPAYPPR